MKNEVTPKYIRPADMKAHFGITRSKTYELIEEKKIISKVMKKRTYTRGIRLIDYQSVIDYLDSLN